MGLGAALMVAGAALAAAALLRLGQSDSLTALPYPRDEGSLVMTGPYRLVRHPIYSGLIFAAFGWALWVNGGLTLVYAALLFAFFDVKSRREERWLSEKYSDYGEYRKRVRKLVPWVY
jgi:protein-S-isoprenylcysteine O-methyltransferase Ste14